MNIPSLFILLSNTFIIYSNISYLPAVLPKSMLKVNDSLIIIPHIHTYRKNKKSLALKYTNIWIFKSREKVLTSSPQIPLLFSGGDENRLLQLKIDLFLTVQ